MEKVYVYLNKDSQTAGICWWKNEYPAAKEELTGDRLKLMEMEIPRADFIAIKEAARLLNEAQISNNPRCKEGSALLSDVLPTIVFRAILARKS